MKITETQLATLQKVKNAGGAVLDSDQAAKALGIDLRSVPPLIKGQYLYRLNGHLFITTDGERELRDRPAP